MFLFGHENMFSDPCTYFLNNVFAGFGILPVIGEKDSKYLMLYSQ
jgi:hypothetical protein